MGNVLDDRRRWAFGTGRYRDGEDLQPSLAVAIQTAHVRTCQTYGPDRLHAELREDGFLAGISRIKRLRKKLGLRCTSVRRFTTTTDSTHALPVAENVLAQTFAIRQPNEAWVTAMIDVPTVEGWPYVAGVKALYTCEMVGLRWTPG